MQQKINKISDLVKKSINLETGELRLNRVAASELISWIVVVELGMEQNAELIKKLKGLLRVDV